MTLVSFAAIALPLAVVFLLARPAGHYIARVYDYNSTGLDRWFGWLEKPFHTLGGIRKDHQSWKQYAASLVISNTVMIVLIYLIFRFQGILPLNPSKIASMEPTLAFHTAVSFMTNTNLQHYSGESGLSYLSQMTAIVFMMFVSPACGLATVIAFIRGITGRPMGNFFTDMLRSVTRLLLPLAFVTALLFVATGVPQTLEPTATATTIEGATQEIARGPIASFLSIKQSGNNGGGFLGVNSAHPFENPNGISNAMQIILMLLLPASMPFTYGKMVGNRKQGRVLFLSMAVMLLVFLGISLASEQAGNPALNALGIQQGGSMEGKEVRFGVAQSSLYSVVTTASETGAVNTMHDTLTPLAGLITMVNMMLNTVFGGAGVGFLNVLMYAIIAVFLSGLMVGRTPEFLGRKIEGREMKLIAVTLIIMPLLILLPTALAVHTYPDTMSNPGFHGLSQALYEFTSSAANNGSGFEGLGDNTRFWNISTGIVMFIGRYFSIVTLLAVAGSLFTKKTVPESSGTFRTDNALFGAVFIVVVVIVGALTYFPAVALGPIAEYLTLKP